MNHCWRKRFRWVTVLATLACAGMLPSGWMQRIAAQEAKTTESEPVVLRVLDEVEVHSAIVFVGDVVKPVGRRPQGWDYVADKAIALIPTDGRRLRLDRQRVLEFIQKSGFIQESMRWSGATYVGIRYVKRSPVFGMTDRKPAVVQQVSASSQTPSTKPKARRSNITRNAAKPQVLAEASEPHPDSAERFVEPALSGTGKVSMLLPAEKNRIERMILAAMQSTHEEVLKEFSVQLVKDQAGLDALEGIELVQSLRLLDPVADGRVRMAVRGATEVDSIQSEIILKLTQLPKVVVTNSALQRGDVLSERDVRLQPIALARFTDRHITRVEDVIGKELNRNMSRDRQLELDDVTEPLIIERGDMVELRAVSPGITTTVQAKALGPAAEGEQLLVEWGNPKRKIYARAVSFGVVEVVSRSLQTGE